MQASELMIGDWVFNAHHGENIQITPYDFFTHGHFEDGRYIPTGVTPSNGWDLEPIPLTPEILEKNGFELGGILKNTYSVGDSNYTITIGKNGRGQCDIMNHLFHIGVTMECCGTVHELQHALRLCGIKKEIKI